MRLGVAAAVVIMSAVSSVACGQATSLLPKSVRAEAGKAALQRRVEQLVCTRYHHGMPEDSVLALGKKALPVLAKLLHDPSKEGCWVNASFAIPLFRDTTYFDTLRAFVWEWHTGQIDQEGLQAMLTAQMGIARMAYSSERAFRYLVATATPQAWTALPWHSAIPGDMLGRDMARVSEDPLDRIRKMRERRAKHMKTPSTTETH